MLFPRPLFAYLARKSMALMLPRLPSRDWQPSAILSVDDDPSTQNFPAMMMVLEVIRDAATLHLQVPAASEQESVCLNSFPGNHYRLLAALVRHLQPKHIVEIGTGAGLVTRMLVDHAPHASCVVTYDLSPCTNFRSHLCPDDFGPGRLEQRLVDLADPAIFGDNLSVLQRAELIILNRPKNRLFAPTLFALLCHTLRSAAEPRFLLIDGIRLLDMMLLWRAIASPKLDLTSFSHWSGTGLVDISQGFRLQDGGVS